ncbi:IclR family transcriptional regulator domain-containing protein [Actinacidiphila epipremni]|uniref:Helix-turn-helix domain-containing protein n=1 Tax=Actinacidiphila epipremni TaxID=2053013 RepID=A0ABX0ZY52_9ACTN|nr:IclR family transcriptional regulator C-terminal domain-containing protein [Actinacidiphila epipremni]NJP46358.1 helix-turn-helix domain-containing protein [Actinacidiphila epipremni]
MRESIHTDTSASPDVPAEAVGPLLRGVAILRTLATAPEHRLTLGELVRTTGLARSTVDRITATLARTGYVRLDGRSASLAPPLMELGNAYLAATRLPELLGPIADRLADTLDESVSLAVPDRDGIRFVHQATRRRSLSLSFRIGDLLPAERTAPGALFAALWSPAQWADWQTRRAADPDQLAFPAAPPGRRGLPDFRQRAARAKVDGSALDDQLIEPGLVAMAVPVHDPEGALVCALSVVSHTSRHSARDLRTALLPALTRARDAMEQVLREPPAPAEQVPARTAEWISASKDELGADFIESLARGLLVPTAFDAGRAELRLSAVAEGVCLARATARRALITLQHLGYVTTEGYSFRLTPALLELGYAPLSRVALPGLAEPHLASLVARVHESASLAVLDGTDIRYTARVATSRIMSVHISVGTRFPAYATSLGRVLLSALPHDERRRLLATEELRPLTRFTITDRTRLDGVLEQVADAGYAVVTDELEVGLRSLAVPVRDSAGRVVGAINVSMHSARLSLAECLSDVLPALRESAAAVESDLRIAGRFTAPPTT